MTMRRVHGAWFVFALAVVVAALGLWKGSFVAGASDAFGYVSEADLIAHGSLRVEQQFVRTLPWPFADWSFAPAGYRPATVRGFIVPTYPVGVPLLMAVFQRLANRNAVFYVVPLLGGLAVWLTSVLGTFVHRRLTGALAAILLATSPSFLVELMAPASDVAATAWWTLALASAVRETSAGAVAAGLATSMAVLTRPNLVPLAAVIGAFFVIRAKRAKPDCPLETRRLALFVAASIPGCVAVALIQQHLYGSPFRSGYESLEALYRWTNAAANLDRYPRWLLQTQTPFIALGWLAPLFARRLASRPMNALEASRVWLLLAFVAVVGGSYLFYRPFGREEWTYLRFLLPAYPALLVLAVAVTLETTRRVMHDTRRAVTATIVICAALAAWQARDAVRRGALTARPVERRYVDVGHYIDTMLPLNSVCIARLHAGSIRYYAGRLTLYYDWLERRWLDDAVHELTARGYHPFIVVEEEEEPAFRERFGELNALGTLDWPPMAERSDPVRVRIYDPLDRDRFRRGEQVTTRPIASWARFR
jgi:hypothetical protein